LLLTKFILKNYGVYRDENEFDFSCSNDKPIILVGGTNGSGKTTLFEAIMFCLYGMSYFGKRATRKSYDKFLDNKIHRYLGTPVSADTASIIVQFKYSHDNKITEYFVDRTWRNEDGKIIEDLTIKKRDSDSEKFLPLDTIEQSQWQSFIEELIPKGIAKLFFFDGEKIARIAREENEDIEIKSSFDSLLGLDLIQQLRSDLQVNLIRSFKGDIKYLEEEFEKLSKEKDETVDEIARLKEKQVSYESEINQIVREIEELEAKVSKLGGGFASKREELKAKKSFLEMKLTVINENIRNLCHGPVPFALIPNQIQEVQTQLEKDQKILKNQFEKEILEDKLKNIKDYINSEKFWQEININQSYKDKFLSKITQVLDQQNSNENQTEKEVFNFSTQENLQLVEVINKEIEQELAQLEANSIEFDQISEDLVKIDTALVHAPKDDEIGPLISELNSKNKEMGTIQTEIRHIEQQISVKQSYIKLLNVKLRNIVAEKFKDKRASTNAKLTEQIQNALDEYEEKLKAKKLELLEGYLLEAINSLMHKKDFIKQVVIDKETFDITLYRDKDDPLPKDLLSEGEKQMYATAVLLALAKTSGKPLPFIIDTPLARLDIAHRQNLIEKFFPYASHQVIIFSTDAEIDAEFYSQLKPYISKSYVMEYLQGKGKTKQHIDAYFWNEKGDKIIAV
jgi:DNA sulfur modification protein DndD